MQAAVVLAVPLAVVWAQAVVLRAHAPSSPPRRGCVDLVDAAKDRPEREAAYAIYTRCRLQGARIASAEPSCRELARLYSVARHYSDSSGRKLESEDFCATAVGASIEQGLMKEVDACVAGAEEVLSSSEVSEAAEKACRRSHPNEAEAPAACRRYVEALSKALRRAPQGELVDAEAICGQLVQGSAATGHKDKASVEESKFVGSCVQFAGSLMSKPGASEDGVRKSCEAHLPSEEKLFCTGYARLVFQRADATDIATFCTTEYRRMTIAKPAAPTREKPVQAPKIVSTHSATALNMGNLCMRLYSRVASAGAVNGPDLKKAATDLCTEELRRLPPPRRPLAARIRVGCRFFGNRLAVMRQQQDGAKDATQFCAGIAAPQHGPALKIHAALPNAGVGTATAPSARATATLVAAASMKAVPQPAAPAQLPTTPSVAIATPTVASVAIPVAVQPSKAVPQPTAPAQLPTTPSVAIATPIVASVAIPVAVQPSKVATLPTVSANAAIPALTAAASAVVPPMPGPEELAKVKSDEDFLNKFLNKYEANTAVAEAAARQLTTPQPQLKVFREEEMAEVRRKAEQLFGNDVTGTASAGAGDAQQAALMPAAPQPQTMLAATQTPAARQSVTSQPSTIADAIAAVAATVSPATVATDVAPRPAVPAQTVVASPLVAAPVAAVAPPAAAIAIPAPPVQAAPTQAVTSPSGAHKKLTAMLAVDSQADASSDFLSSFLNAYSPPKELSVGAASESQQSRQTTVSALHQQLQLPQATVAATPALPALSQEPATSEVDSLVSAFLARS